MPRRSKASQSQHDAEVRRIADQFKNRGYDVQADVSGYRRPQTIGGLRPDVIAERGFERKIVEVETSESRDALRDVSQRQAFGKLRTGLGTPLFEGLW